MHENRENSLTDEISKQMINIFDTFMIELLNKIKNKNNERPIPHSHMINYPSQNVMRLNNENMVTQMAH